MIMYAVFYKKRHTETWRVLFAEQETPPDIEKVRKVWEGWDIDLVLTKYTKKEYSL